MCLQKRFFLGPETFSEDGYIWQYRAGDLTPLGLEIWSKIALVLQTQKNSGILFFSYKIDGNKLYQFSCFSNLDIYHKFWEEEIVPYYSNYKENYTETSARLWNHKPSSMRNTDTENQWYYKTESRNHHEAWKHSSSNLDFENVNYFFLVYTIIYGKNKEFAVEGLDHATFLVNGSEFDGCACYVWADSNDGKKCMNQGCYRDCQAAFKVGKKVGETLGGLLGNKHIQEGDQEGDGLLMIGNEEQVKQFGPAMISNHQPLAMDVMVARKGWYF